MSIKKMLGLIGSIGCVLLLILVGIRVLSWQSFWLIILAIGGFAYFILPKMHD